MNKKSFLIWLPVCPQLILFQNYQVILKCLMPSFQEIPVAHLFRTSQVELNAVTLKAGPQNACSDGFDVHLAS